MLIFKYFKTYRLFFYLAVLFTCTIHSSVFSQNSVLSGYVTDNNTGEPLTDVHVYLSQTTSGTVTKSDGSYKLTTSETGLKQVVVTIVGYHTTVSDLYVAPGSSHEVHFTMEPESVELNSIEITASNQEWQRHLARFNDHFIGQTLFANETNIENFWVLDFTVDIENRLHANASEPLIITNYALGYKIFIDLIEFVIGPGTENASYTFYSRFEALENQDANQLQEWERNREFAYRGSFHHFLKSLYDDELSRNRFEIVSPGTTVRTSIEEIHKPESRRIIARYTLSDHGNLRVFRLTQPVDILYGRRGLIRNQKDRSRLVQMHNSGIFIITENGTLLDPSSLRIDGVWALDRVANLLPDDYELAD